MNLLARGLLLLGLTPVVASGCARDADAPGSATGAPDSGDAAAQPGTPDSGGGAAQPGKDVGGCPFPGPRDVPWPFAPSSSGEMPSAYCPAGCAPVEGYQRNDEETCRMSVLLGCIPCSSGCGGAPEGPCLESLADQRIITGPSYALEYLRDGWVVCTDAEREQLLTSNICAR